MEFHPKKRSLIFTKPSLGAVGALALSICSSVSALDYGIFDSRAMAMGGTTVAAASVQNAHFYNPALLALSDGTEEETRKGRVYLPMMVGQIADSIETTLDVVDADLDQNLQNSVDAFNLAPSTETAAQVSVASRELQTALVEVGGQDLDGDVFVGISVSEPSHREGGAFYLGTRVIAGGRNNLSQGDLDLLEDYIEVVDFIASDGAEGTEHLELLDADGNLLDPTPNTQYYLQFEYCVCGDIGMGRGCIKRVSYMGPACGVWHYAKAHEGRCLS